MKLILMSIVPMRIQVELSTRVSVLEVLIVVSKPIGSVSSSEQLQSHHGLNEQRNLRFIKDFLGLKSLK